MGDEAGLNPARDDERAGATSTIRDRSPNDAGLGETVKAGTNRASALGEDAADHIGDRWPSRKGEGFVQVLDGLAEFVRRQPMSALLIAAGVGLRIGRLLALEAGAGRR